MYCICTYYALLPTLFRFMLKSFAISIFLFSISATLSKYCDLGSSEVSNQTFSKYSSSLHFLEYSKLRLTSMKRVVHFLKKLTAKIRFFYDPWTLLDQFHEISIERLSEISSFRSATDTRWEDSAFHATRYRPTRQASPILRSFLGRGTGNAPWARGLAPRSKRNPIVFQIIFQISQLWSSEGHSMATTLQNLDSIALCLLKNVNSKEWKICIVSWAIRSRVCGIVEQLRNEEKHSGNYNKSFDWIRNWQ